MRFKSILGYVEEILDVVHPDGAPRADMYLPNRLLAGALILLLGGLGGGVYCCFRFQVWVLLAAVAAFAVGVGALLCWRNQTIRMISDTEFVYTTFLGNRRSYTFSQITAMRRNRDSVTLFLGEEKVHIESMAVLSPRLERAIRSCFQQ